MDPTLSSADLSSSKTSGLTSGILSSLSSLFGPNTLGAGVFASFLAEQQVTTPTAPTNPQINQSATSTQNIVPQETDNETDSQNNNSSPAGTLGSLISRINRIINKLKNQSNNNTQSTNSSSDAANTATSQSNTTTAPEVQTASNMDSTSSNTTVAGNDSNNNDTTDTGSLSGLLVKLTDLMKFMEKKLETMQAGTGTSIAQTNKENNDPNSDAADPLTQLLSLMQMMQQQLAGTVTGSLSASATATTSGTTATGSGQTSPLSAALQDLLQLQKDLKGLIASFQGGDAAASSTTAGDSVASSAGTTGMATDSLMKAMDQTASDKPSLASLDGFFDMFGGTFNNAFSNTFSTGTVPSANANMLVAATDTLGDAFSDTSSNTMSQDNGTSSDSGSTNLNSLNANTATVSSGQTDSPKSADPYAFASQLSAARAANGGMTGLPDAVEQVFLQLNRGVKDGNDQMTIQLHPAELGKINIKLDISTDGQVSGTVVADNPSTLSLLHKDVRSLERALQEAGLRADPGSLQFSMSGQGGNTSGQTANNFNSNTSSGGTSYSGTNGTSVNAGVPADEIYYLTPGRVNMKV